MWIDERPVVWTPQPDWSQVEAETADFTGADWQRLRDAIQAMGLAPRLQVGLGELPSEREDLVAFAAWLRDCRILNIERTDKILRRTQELLAACAAHGVEVMALKGAAIRGRYEVDPALRPTSDIDLLIAREQFDRFDRLAAELGYRLTKDEPRHRLYRHVDDVGCESRSGEHPSHPVWVEAHDRVWLARPVLLDYDLTARYRASATAGEVDGLPLLLPSSDALLEHLLLHLACDFIGCQARAVQALDLPPVAAALTAGEWQRLGTALAAGGVLRWAWVSVAMVRRMAPLPLPEDFEALLESNTPERFRDVAAQVDWSALTRCRQYRSLAHTSWRWTVEPRQRARLATYYVQHVVCDRLARMGRAGR